MISHGRRRSLDSTLRMSVALSALAGAVATAQPAATAPPSGRTETVVPVEQAPYHVPVLSNDYVTVLNVFIPPQRTSGFHRHALDTIIVRLSDGERMNQVLGAAATPVVLQPVGSVNFQPYGGEAMIHSATMTGDKPLHNVVVELSNATSYGFTPGSREGVAGYTQVLDNERVRVWRLALEPGTQAAAITQRAPGMRVVVAGGEFLERVPGRPDRGMAVRAAEFYWQEPGVTRSVHNTGTTRIELVEIELK